MKLKKNNYNSYKKDGYVLIDNLINKHDLNIISKRIKYLERKQKDGRGLSEPGTKNL